MAERHAPRGFSNLQTIARLEKLAFFINQRHKRHRHAKQSRGQNRQAIERFIRRRVHQVILGQRTQARFFSAVFG
ncbi:hypothetical protein COLO4_02092 [Corchorus olitorius]|uniref:Uncharacterized protein n=1 Tax=Corchorus olitorius TaxID=93759 RepID=A0A1R3L1H1_9ROSI|nr:hypothetical protein COLO4_02092 [Corchorus olitorius]